MRILVVEDNHRLNSSLAASLAHEGYSVDSAYDGQKGQDLAELTAYDLIILDVLLPEKDGLAVCHDLRRRRIQTPILHAPSIGYCQLRDSRKLNSPREMIASEE